MHIVEAYFLSTFVMSISKHLVSYTAIFMTVMRMYTSYIIYI